MAGFGVSSGFLCSHDGVDDNKGGGILLLDRWVLEVI